MAKIRQKHNYYASVSIMHHIPKDATSRGAGVRIPTLFNRMHFLLKGINFNLKTFCIVLEP